MSIPPTATEAYEYLERNENGTANVTAATATVISVNDESSLEIASQFTEQFDRSTTCLLNLANQFKVGGDYLSGPGQEESIIKGSNLLHSLCSLPNGIRDGNACNPYKYSLVTTLRRFSDEQHKDQ